MTGRRDYNVAFQTAQSQNDSLILIMTADVFTLTSPGSHDLLKVELCVQKQHVGRQSVHRCDEDVNTATRSSCPSTCYPASILLRACSAIRCPRALLSLASAPLICDGKPIPLVNLPPKSYDWGYGNDTESLCDTESCCDFASALRNTHLSHGWQS